MRPPVRLRFATGETWLPSAGSGRALAGGVAIAGSAAVTALRGTADLPAGLSAWRDEADPAARGAYAVAVLGDLHFDTLPESVYHADYDETNPYAQTQHEEFRRNGEMWRDRIPSLLAASSALATTGASSAPATAGASSVPATAGAKAAMAARRRGVFTIRKSPLPWSAVPFRRKRRVARRRRRHRKNG